jgi:hypothetical protein
VVLNSEVWRWILRVYKFYKYEDDSVIERERERDFVVYNISCTYPKARRVRSQAMTAAAWEAARLSVRHRSGDELRQERKPIPPRKRSAQTTENTQSLRYLDCNNQNHHDLVSSGHHTSRTKQALMSWETDQKSERMSHVFRSSHQFFHCSCCGRFLRLVLAAAN